jgi:hypothetical protein
LLCSCFCSAKWALVCLRKLPSLFKSSRLRQEASHAYAAICWVSSFSKSMISKNSCSIQFGHPSTCESNKSVKPPTFF